MRNALVLICSLWIVGCGTPVTIAPNITLAYKAEVTATTPSQSAQVTPSSVPVSVNNHYIPASEPICGRPPLRCVNQ